MNKFTRASAPSGSKKKRGQNQAKTRPKNIPTPARPHQTSIQGRGGRRRKTGKTPHRKKQVNYGTRSILEKASGRHGKMAKSKM